MTFNIVDYNPKDLSDLLQVSHRAWTPVFAALAPIAEPFVMEAFYPDGWWARQNRDIEALANDDAVRIWVAKDNHGTLIGFVGARLHPEDSMGEIYILAVDPAHQRKGIGTALMNLAFDRIKDAGMSIVMVETGDDPGHAPAQAAYERIGFKRWPVARYFRRL
ncbi:MAG: GNAT family N-acetyltransferase [Pseudomonadota bacterium]